MQNRYLWTAIVIETITILGLGIVTILLIVNVARWEILTKKAIHTIQEQNTLIDNYQKLVNDPVKFLLTPQQQCILFYEQHCDSSGELPDSTTKTIPMPTTAPHKTIQLNNSMPIQI